jgi:catechol 2,3-dioxygenase-like lactoylglutathione lyase family enzyme
MNRLWHSTPGVRPRFSAASILLAMAMLIACLVAAVDLAQTPVSAGAPALALQTSELSAGPVRAQAVSHIAISVESLPRSIEFFTEVLDFEVVSRDERWGEQVEQLYGIFGARVRTARLRVGSEEIELIEFMTPRGRLIPRESRSNDLWFQHIAIVVSDIEAAYARLREHDIRHASTAPQTLPLSNPNAGGISAFYFHDPDGHVLEIIHFPAGKGDPRWREAATSGATFLGIDHTAIVVADTEESLRFYRDQLGMSIAGGSENIGAEQARLNNVKGAHLRITTLKAPGGGPGVEFLEYLHPGRGRPYPADSLANDLWSWHTVIKTDGAGNSQQRIVRDPDGHALMLVP